MRISDWSSDVCSSDLTILLAAQIDLSNSLIYNLVIVSGTLLAGIAGGLIGDRVGRRKMIIISSILGFCSAASFMWLINYSPALGMGAVFFLLAILTYLGTVGFLYIGRASCRERVCHYVYITVCADSLP